jgi:hypothetical protein
MSEIAKQIIVNYKDGSSDVIEEKNSIQTLMDRTRHSSIQPTDIIRLRDSRNRTLLIINMAYVRSIKFVYEE